MWFKCIIEVIVLLFPGDTAPGVLLETAFLSAKARKGRLQTVIH